MAWCLLSLLARYHQPRISKLDPHFFHPVVAVPRARPVYLYNGCSNGFPPLFGLVLLVDIAGSLIGSSAECAMEAPRTGAFWANSLGIVVKSALSYLWTAAGLRSQSKPFAW